MVLRHLLGHALLEAGQVALVQLQPAELRHGYWVFHWRNALTLIVDVLYVAFMFADDAKAALPPAEHAAHLAPAVPFGQEFGNEALSLLAGVHGAELVDVVRPLRHVVPADVLDLVVDPVSLGHDV